MSPVSPLCSGPRSEIAPCNVHLWARGRSGARYRHSLTAGRRGGANKSPLSAPLFVCVCAYLPHRASPSASNYFHIHTSQGPDKGRRRRGKSLRRIRGISRKRRRSAYLIWRRVLPRSLRGLFVVSSLRLLPRRFPLPPSFIFLSLSTSCFAKPFFFFLSLSSSPPCVSLFD